MPKSPLLSTLMAPFSLRASHIITSGANQIRASQARCSLSRSSQVMTRASSRAHSPLSATKVLEMPCNGEVTHPAMTPSMIATSHFSAVRSGPRCASSVWAMWRAPAISCNSGRARRKISHGTMVSVSIPGRIEPESQRPHVRSTCPILWANSAISGLAAMPVRNMAEAA